MEAVLIVVRLIFLFRFTCSDASPDTAPIFQVGQPFSAPFFWALLGLILASGGFATSAFAAPPLHHVALRHVALRLAR